MDHLLFEVVFFFFFFFRFVESLGLCYHLALYRLHTLAFPKLATGSCSPGPSVLAQGQATRSFPPPTLLARHRPPWDTTAQCQEFAGQLWVLGDSLQAGGGNKKQHVSRLTAHLDPQILNKVSSNRPAPQTPSQAWNSWRNTEFFEETGSLFCEPLNSLLATLTLI